MWSSLCKLLSCDWQLLMFVMLHKSALLLCLWMKSQCNQWKFFVLSSRFMWYFIQNIQCFLSIRRSWRIIPNSRRCQELCLNMWPLWASCLVWWQRNLCWTCQRLNKISLVRTIIRPLYRQVKCWIMYCIICYWLWPRPHYAREFENGDFALKTHQMFSLCTLRRRNLKTQESQVISVGFVFEENSLREITWLLWLHRFQQAPFSKCFTSTRKRKAGVFNFLLSFSWRISVDGRSNRRNKAAFSNFSGVVWTVPLSSCPHQLK